MFPRLARPIKTRSFFLFGPRGTGKSTFLKSFLAQDSALWFNLLDPELEDLFSRNPNQFRDQIQLKENQIEWVIVDEVQKVPKLLNIVHHLIESTSVKFALTGSSAKKLKKEGANLLAGRAFVNYLFPLTSVEMEKSFVLDEALRWGTLPTISHLQSEKEKEAYVKAYALTYLKEEIWAEHIVKNLDPFRRFLTISAQLNTEIVNHTNIARDVGVSDKTISAYFEILEDTLVGFSLPAFHRSVRKQQRQAPKFYFFDVGVANALGHTIQQRVVPNTYGYGKAFEHFIVTEIHRLNYYRNSDYKLYYLRTKDQAEVDLIIEKPDHTLVLIEIKSGTEVDERDCHILQALLAVLPGATAMVLSNDLVSKKIGSVVCHHWKTGLSELGL
jgi:predicted AAA+ superfamily ATPase